MIGGISFVVCAICVVAIFFAYRSGEAMEHSRLMGGISTEWLNDHLEFERMFPKHAEMLLKTENQIVLRKCATGEGMLRMLRVGARLQLCGQARLGAMAHLPWPSRHYNITFTAKCIEVTTDGEASLWTNGDANDLCITLDPPTCVPSE